MLLCCAAASVQTSETYRRHDFASLDEDWETSKRAILDGLGFAQGKDAIAQAAGVAQAQAQAYDEQTRRRGAMSSSGAQYAAPIGASGPVLGMEQAIYARSVQELNRARVRQQLVPVLSMLRSSAAAVDEFFQRQSSSLHMGGDVSGHQNLSANGLAVGDVTDCWDVVRFMLQRECDNAAGTGADVPLVEKEFAASYDAPANSPEGARFRTQLIDGAKAYSESLFAAYIKRVVAAHPESRRGAQQGRSAFARQVAAYVSVLGEKLPAACRDMQLEGLPLWPQVYYCFRCGQVSDALQLLTLALEQSGGMGGRMGGFGSGASAHHEQLTRVFVEAMEKRATGERALSPSLWMALHEEYQRELAAAVNAARAHQVSSAQAGSFVDPFKLALYHLLGRFQLPSHVDLSALVAPTTEDYLWLKLSVLHEGAGADALAVPQGLRDHVDAGSLRLADLQAGLLARGEGAFNPDGRRPLAYFKVLLLSQQFEQAVYYLIKTAHFTVGVHFAVALDYAGCLHEHTNSRQELLVALSGAGAPGSGLGASFAINYSRVLRKYVESFVRSHPLEAFHYLYLLHPQHSGAGAGAKSAAARSRAGLGLGSSNTSFGLLSPGLNDSSMDDGGGNPLDVSGVGAASMATDPSFPALRDLLLETREFDLLVGSIVPVGGAQAAALNGSAADSIQTSRGLVYTYFSRAEAAALLVATGAELEAHGLLLDAVQLYLLAYRFDLAVELALKALAPVVATGVHSEERQGVVACAQRVQRVVRAQQEAGQHDRASRGGNGVGDASALSLSALHKLLCLVNYFDLYHLGPAKYDDARAVLEPLSLVPFRAGAEADLAALFLNDAATHVQLRRTIAHVAVSLMDIYYVKFQIVKREMHSAASSVYVAAQVQRDNAKHKVRLTHRRHQRPSASY